MANPPMRNVMKFHFFNLTNPDEVLYYGAKPELVESSAYACIESEQKKYIEFNKEGSQLFYQNYKKYIYDSGESDEGTSFDDIVVFPNPTATGAVAAMADPEVNMSRTTKLATSIALLLLGEYPIITKKVREVLFDGYNDALLDIAHSPLLNVLSILLNEGKSIIPVAVPDMKKFGYFMGYNNSYDENFFIKTGKDDIDDLGGIVSWAGVHKLPSSWWSTDYSREIRGSDSASFCKTKLKETDELPFFQSFICRSFTKTFSGKGVIQGIPAMEFSVPYEDFDTTSEKNAGFRYKNVEKVDYYPDWPGCPRNFCNSKCQSETCRFCCGRNIVNGTHLLPPGMFPLVCYPGHLKPAPFSVIYSAPHFLYSPEQVRKSVSGISPCEQKHRPMVYQHEQFTGSVIQVDYRIQINMPVMKSSLAVQTTSLPNVDLLEKSVIAMLKRFNSDNSSEAAEMRSQHIANLTHMFWKQNENFANRSNILL
ncbi:unnamed protein product [Caenorhabditis auriculariae]|uniref:Uncharacterized protein n=1 Tax=Caenorhabditis auriculariae TaxID=2777116 RepID=A0A8S1H4D1_9PELO|nr:unnamed protein product [Caenorhabditis auriculariae]